MNQGKRKSADRRPAGRGGPRRIRQALVSRERVMLIAEFRAALAAFLDRSERGARASGLTSQRYLLLLMVKGAADGSETITLGDLAARLGISPNTASELVTRAAKAGLVSRARTADDQRLVHLALTGEGERRLSAAIRATDQDRRALGEAFERLASTFDQATQATG